MNSEQLAAESIVLAEAYLVEADASETRSHASMARDRARLAGDAYVAAAHHLSRPAAVDEGGEGDRLWNKAADLLRKASDSYLRGLARGKSKGAAKLAEAWGNAAWVRE